MDTVLYDSNSWRDLEGIAWPRGLGRKALSRRLLVLIGDESEWSAPVAHAIALACHTGAELRFLSVLTAQLLCGMPEMMGAASVDVASVTELSAQRLAWAVSIVVRWPLLGVVVGTALGQRTRWRRDPALLRAYGRASWVWAATYVLRVAVFVPLWLGGQVVGLVVARVALTWPLVAAALAVSWVVIRRSLPAEHPGLRHPLAPSDADAAPAK